MFIHRTSLSIHRKSLFINRKSLAIAGILAASLTLAACAPSETGAGGDPSSSSTEGFNDQDVMFAQMMLPHHQQAVEMSDMILAKEGIDSQVTELAQTIKDEQEPEIQQMQGWLEDWNASADMGGKHEGMSGMMSDGEMSDLDAASGGDASRLFLEQMTKHHNGAIAMAQTELDKGEYPEATELAQTIIDAQQAEIDRRQSILSTL